MMVRRGYTAVFVCQATETHRSVADVVKEESERSSPVQSRYVSESVGHGHVKRRP